MLEITGPTSTGCRSITLRDLLRMVSLNLRGQQIVGGSGGRSYPVLNGRLKIWDVRK